MNRKAKRAAKFAQPNPVSGPPIATPSPPPQVTLANAGEGVDVNRGNSDKLPLSPAGMNQAKQLAEQFARKGGLDAVVSAPSVRTKQTAAPILAANPQGAVPTRDEPGLESWAQGNLEGEQKRDVQGQIRELIRKQPSRVIPGQGAMSSMPGESFDQFRGRALPAVRGVMQQFAEGISQNPDFKLGVPIHSQVTKLTRAWLKKGAPDDFSIHAPEMDRHADEPGGVEHLFPNEKGEWQMTPVDMKSAEALGPGIYMIRHATTPQSAENTAMAEAQQTHLAKLVQATQDMNFQGAQRHAKAASAAGMSDEDIGKYVDSALPDHKTAAQLPMPQLLAVMAAAGPEKRNEYAPLLQSHFGGMDALPPHERQALQNHISQMGYTPAPAQS